MLPRVLEPEVMDSPEEALAYDSMDHTEVNRLFVDDLLQAARRFDVPLDGIILDVGTGTAQIPVELCSRAPDYRVLGIDLAAAMLDLGQARVDAAGLRDQIQLQQHDAKSLPFDDGQFACVMSNSIVHHIPEPAAVLEQMWRVLRPGGLIFVRDLMRPGDEAALDDIGLALGVVPGLAIAILVGVSVRVSVSSVLRSTFEAQGSQPRDAASRISRAKESIEQLQKALDDLLERTGSCHDAEERRTLEEQCEGLRQLVRTRRSVLEETA